MSNNGGGNVPPPDNGGGDNNGNQNGGNGGNANGGNANGNNGNGNTGNGNAGNGNGNGAGTTTRTTSRTTSTSSRIPASAPEGLLSITQPPQTATSFYKIAPSQQVTFAWTFQYVLATPTHLTVMAVCNDNSVTYPVGPSSGLLPGTATEVVWDPYAWQTENAEQPLIQGAYRLVIADEARGTDAPRKAGFLTGNSALTFMLYTPQPYTGLADGWACTACSGSIRSMTTHPVFMGSLVMLLVMFLSGFTLIRSATRLR